MWRHANARRGGGGLWVGALVVVVGNVGKIGKVGKVGTVRKVRNVGKVEKSKSPQIAPNNSK